MRKVFILMAILVLPLMVTKAQNNPAQPAPIIAMADGKLYKVSAVDGSATLLADAKSDESITPLRVGSISPDNKYLVYVKQGPFTADSSYKSDLYRVTIADGTTKLITPKGGIFDVPVNPDEQLSLDMPTWSSDGQRIYYFRSIYGTKPNAPRKPILFAYYDVATGKHELVTRIDPQDTIFNMDSVKDGITTQWQVPSAAFSPFMTLFGPDNQIVNQSQVNVPYEHTLRGDDEAYFVQLKDLGQIDFKVGAMSGVQDTMDDGYYPAAESLNNSEKSMHVISVQSDTNIFDIYGADYHKLITSITNNTSFVYALSPDGQQMAYLL
ncbi:MAG: hypothetical protein ABI970_14885, partial [Chloroflexota bacterium]